MKICTFYDKAERLFPHIDEILLCIPKETHKVPPTLIRRKEQPEYMATLWDLLFPPRSILGQEGGWVSGQELQMLEARPIDLHKKELVAMGCTDLHSVVAALSYEAHPILPELIHRFKYRRMPQLVDALGELLSNACDRKSIPEESVLCPVPLHWTRLFHRGFNQAALLAEFLSKMHHIPVRHLLKRTRPTGHQAHRKKQERASALINAFALKRCTDIPLCVVLVDDVMTTGSTLQECARVLRKNGVSEVHAVCVALG